jgi:hypothetical protein
MSKIVASFKDNSDVKAIQSEGFVLAGEKYMTIRADEKSLYGKKVRLRLPVHTERFSF